MREFKILVIEIILILGCAKKEVIQSPEKQAKSESTRTIFQASPPPSEIPETGLEEAQEEKFEIGPSDIIDLLEEEESAEIIDKLLSVHTEYDIPMILNEKVKYFIRYFRTEQRDRFKRWLERSSRYIDIMKRILKEHNLPQDLVYMALIESGFSPYAFSRARATGPWQFIKSTGKKYGLRVDPWVDERRDPIKSTFAAARYLKDLYDVFGSWYLAAAGYNAGEKKILSAMRKHRTAEFWELAETRYLKKETRDYVPKLIAAAVIAKNPELFGFTDLNYEEPFTYEVILLPFPIDLVHVEARCGVPMEEIKFYNPELKRWFTPPDRKEYELRVPPGKGEMCFQELQKVPPSERLRFKRYVVQKGETPYLLARMFNITSEEIIKLNGKTSFRPGSEILIPVHEWEQPKKIFYASRGKRRYRDVKVQGYERLFYTVQSGDTLWDIARKFDVNISDLKRWNKIEGNTIFPGDILAIYLKKHSPSISSDEADFYIYVVRKGDTLWTISKKFGVSVTELKNFNNLKVSRIYPGLKLKIPRK